MYVNYLFLVFKTTKPKQKLMCVYRVSVFKITYHSAKEFRKTAL